MVSAKIFEERRNKSIILLVIFSCIVLLSLFSQQPTMLSKSHESLVVKQSYEIPLREISGMHLHNQEVYFIGDKYPKILKMGLSETTLAKNSTVFNFKNLILDKFSVCQNQYISACRKMAQTLTSQWEAIYVDKQENIFALNEQLASIFVFTKDAKSLQTIINLDFFSGQDRSDKRMLQIEQNALGEGLIPLSNGHILVSKERDQAAIIEFAEAEETAQGYAPNLVTSKEVPLNYKKPKITMLPVKSWILPSHLKHCDFSELTTNAAGELFLLSQKCQMISKISGLTPEVSVVKIEKSWHLPYKIRSAEAFVVLGEETFLVAEDKKDFGYNVSLLTM